MTKAIHLKKNLKATKYIIFYYILISILTFWFLSQNGYIYIGADAQFHINRIEELAANLKLNNLFPFISTFSANKVGIGTNIFYPGLWLYPFALLRLCISNPIHAVYTGLMLINFLTCIIAHFTFRSFSGSQSKAFIFTNLYFFSTYRWIDIFNRFDISEFIALAIIPLVFWGFYETLFKNSKMWPWLAVGMSLLLYAHILSFLIITFFLFLIFLMNFKKINNFKTRFMKLLFAALTFFILTIGFLFTFVKTYLSINIQSPRPFELSQTALQLGKLFDSSLSNHIYGASSQFNLGLMALVIGVLVLLYFKQLPSVYKQISLWLVFCVFTATNLFPWLFLQDTGISMIQFPWRVFIVGNLFLCIVGTEVFSFIKIKYVNQLLTLSLILLSIGSITQFVSIQQHAPTLKHVFLPYESLFNRYNIKINSQAYKYLTIVSPNKDYIPINLKYTNLENRRMYNQVATHHIFVYYKPVAVRHVKPIPNGTILSLPKIGKRTMVSLPFYIYQKHNYRVWVNGKRAKFGIDRFKLIKLHLHGARNTIKIQYFPSKIQMLSIWISILGFIILIIYGFYLWIKKSHNSYFEET